MASPLGIPAPRAVAGPGRRARPAVALGALGLVISSLSGCYAPQLVTLHSGLDSLRAVVDTLTVRDSVAYRVLLDTRRELAEQRDILLSTRASSGSTTQELFEQMGRLEGKLDEVMQRFTQITQRTTAPPATAGGPDAAQLYDQAAQDLTQGRYALALQGFRECVARFPTAELADNAQYGVGECFFAQARWDSAATEYARVEAINANGDKLPASLYKLGLCQERKDRAADGRKTFEELIRRFPNSGEAQLARDRVGKTRRK